MANKVLITQQDDTPPQIVFRDSTDFSPTAANNLQVGTPTAVQLDTTDLADGAARQSTKFDFGTDRATSYKVRAAVELAATPTAGDLIELYLAPSGSATAGTANAGSVAGSDSAYTGYSTNLAAAVKQLELISVLIVTADATATVQIIEGQVFTPTERYGSLVVKNESGAAFHSDAVETHIVFDPIIEEVQ